MVTIAQVLFHVKRWFFRLSRHAATSGAEALGAHIRWMEGDGDIIPPPSDLDAVVADPDLAGGIPVVITPSLQCSGKAVRLNVTLDEYLVSSFLAEPSGQ